MERMREHKVRRKREAGAQIKRERGTRKGSPFTHTPPCVAAGEELPRRMKQRERQIPPSGGFLFWSGWVNTEQGTEEIRRQQDLEMEECSCYNVTENEWISKIKGLPQGGFFKSQELA